MENEKFKLENPENLRAGLGPITHLKLMGKKAAAFSSRIKKAISDKFHAFIKENKIIGNAIFEKSYQFVEEDYQKIMNKKTAKLDEKIEDINRKIEAVKNAEIGTKSNQVTDEKERSYLLEKWVDRKTKAVLKQQSIITEQNQLNNIQLDNKVEISGKRKILIGLLDLKKITTNAAKMTGKIVKGTAIGIVNMPGHIINANKAILNKINETKQKREAKKEAKAEEDLASMKFLEQISNLSDKEYEQVKEIYNSIGNAYENKATDFLTKLNSDPKLYAIAMELATNDLPKDFVQFKQEAEQNKILAQMQYNKGKEDGINETKKQIEDLKKQIEDLKNQFSSLAENNKKNIKKTTTAKENLKKVKEDVEKEVEKQTKIKPKKAKEDTDTKKK